MTNSYTINSDWDFITIYINGLLHIELPREINIATETWVDTLNGFTKYCIQFVNAETGKVILIGEYDCKQKWASIIKLWQNRNKKHQNKLLKK